MSFLKKLLPFLFKSDSDNTNSSSRTANARTGESKPAQGKSSPAKTGGSSAESEEGRQQSPIVAYGIVARSKSARGLRKGSKVYVRSILEDGERLRVRGTAPNGQKVTLTVPRRTLNEYQSEGVPEHVAKHYDKHSLFPEEHEARVKAEALGKH